MASHPCAPRLSSRAERRNDAVLIITYENTGKKDEAKQLRKERRDMRNREEERGFVPYHL